MDHQPDHLKYYIAAVIIAFGAAAHATNQLKLARQNELVFTWVDFAILVPTAMFSGLMFGLAAEWLSENTIHMLLSSGAGAFLGIAGLNRLSNFVIDSLTRNKNDN